MIRYCLFFLLLTIFLSLIYIVESLLLSDDLVICARLTEVFLICE